MKVVLSQAYGRPTGSHDGCGLSYAGKPCRKEQSRNQHPTLVAHEYSLSTPILSTQQNRVHHDLGSPLMDLPLSLAPYFSILLEYAEYKHAINTKSRELSL